jgi:hypothetical protein
MHGLQYHGFSAKVDQFSGSVPDNPSDSAEPELVFELFAFLFEALLELGAGCN